ncbi:MAG: ATP-binding protein [Bacteroidota bacterium]
MSSQSASEQVACKKIVVNHDGDIAESRPGHGTVMHIILPLNLEE